MSNKLLTNYTEITFLDKIKESLKTCDEFYFSVSFIKKAGLILLLEDIKKALARGVKGKLITSTYQNFTDIDSLNEFKKLMDTYNNFECHLDFECFVDVKNELTLGYHSKGYLFKQKDYYEIIIGSSNITRFALLKNIEWDLLLKEKEPKVYLETLEEFFSKWDKTILLDNDIISKYSDRLNYAISAWDMDYDTSSSLIKPNFMQRKALKEINRYRSMGVTKALVVAATGSGKTYLAAFDAKNFGAKRVLFICHRDKILADSLESFRRVFGESKTYGLFVGDKKELGCDFLFASNIMLATHLDEFTQDEFDYICIDEAHHSVASSYKKIIDYFKPEFLLGITATPDRMDNEDVYDLFDKNVPYELSLRDAIVNDLVVPFHYYGIRDFKANYGFREQNLISKTISSQDNVLFIASEIEKHRIKGKLKAIAFCANIAHAIMMAEKFNEVGYNAISLTGRNDLGQRIKAFSDLQDDSKDLEIICAVDILNEGVDIPQINMVLFLRPTESQTIFLQQLGRGLRKYEGKDYVTVLDFIGNNYDRSVQIAMALGSLSKSNILEKRYLIDLLRTDFVSLDIKGLVINIDSLAKEDIIKYITNTNFNTKDFLKKDYSNFKEYLHLNTYPSHMDYLNSDCAPDLMRLIKSKISGKKNKSYYNFLTNVKEPSLPLFTDSQIAFLETLEDMLPLVRQDEYLILKSILENGKLDLNSLVGYSSKVTFNTLANALYFLRKDKLVNSKDELNVDKLDESFKEYLLDTLVYGLTRYDIDFGDYEGKFKLYGNYYKDQIMKVLLEKTTMFLQGTKFDKDGTTYVFIGIKKDKEKIERTNYKDKFLSPTLFQWESRNDTTFTNSEGIKIMNTKLVHLFVRKMDEEDGVTLPFTYFGTGKFTNLRPSFVESSDKKLHDTILLDIELDNEVKKEYFVDFEIPEVIKE